MKFNYVVVEFHNKTKKILSTAIKSPTWSNFVRIQLEFLIWYSINCTYIACASTARSRCSIEFSPSISVVFLWRDSIWVTLISVWKIRKFYNENNVRSVSICKFWLILILIRHHSCFWWVLVFIYKQLTFFWQEKIVLIAHRECLR